MKYRAEIDGLRALAVLPVILFHAGFELFSGGFVGVDVFFVISGYLITLILIEQIESGCFSFADFYERRARRILPALVFVIIISFPFAWAWMNQAQFDSYLKSLIAVSLFSSNMFFWQESGYFAAAAETKPLLHTWSLAVEEQYYLIFPVYLVVAWHFGKKVVFRSVIFFSLISLILCEWAWRNLPEANFYFAPTRAWELFAGSIAAFFIYDKGVQKSNSLSVLGLAFIVFSIFFYDESTPFPSLYTLVPVTGVALIIIYGSRGTVVSKLLSTKALVGIGLISYSAYLWHQPLFAFFRLRVLEAPSSSQMGLLSIVALVFGFLSWRYIEKPFRNRSLLKKSQIFRLSALSIVSMISISFYAYHHSQNNESGQYNPVNKIKGAKENKYLQRESWSLLRERSNNVNYGVSRNSFDNTDWVSGNKKKRLVLVGNSHSKDLYNVLINSNEVSGSFEITRYGEQISNLNNKHRFWQSPNYKASDAVIIVSRYSKKDIKKLPSIIGRVKSEDKLIVIVKNIFEFPEYQAGSLSLIDVTRFKQGWEISGINQKYYKVFSEGVTSPSVELVNLKLEKISRDSDLILLSREDYYCKPSLSICEAVSGDGDKYFYDYGHHSLLGGKYFGARVDETNWFSKVIDEINLK